MSDLTVAWERQVDLDVEVARVAIKSAGRDQGGNDLAAALRIKAHVYTIENLQSLYATALIELAERRGL